MTTKSAIKSKKKEMGQLNLKYEKKFLDKLRKNAKRKDMTPTQYIKDLVTKDGWGLDNTEISAINTQLHVIDIWTKKVFYTTDSFAKLFMRYIFETLKYMPAPDSNPEEEDKIIYRAIDRYRQFLETYRATKNYYKESFLNQMFKTEIETAADFEKFNPLKMPDADADTIEKLLRYNIIMNDARMALKTVFTVHELDGISIICHEINWKEVSDIKSTLRETFNNTLDEEFQQLNIDREKIEKQIPHFKEAMLFSLVDYIEDSQAFYFFKRSKKEL